MKTVSAHYYMRGLLTENIERVEFSSVFCSLFVLLLSNIRLDVSYCLESVICRINIYWIIILLNIKSIICIISVHIIFVKRISSGDAVLRFLKEPGSAVS